MPGVDSASKEGGFGVCSVFRVAGTLRFDNSSSKRRRMLCIKYDKICNSAYIIMTFNARDTIIEYMQLELSHSSTATRDARARKVSHAVK